MRALRAVWLLTLALAAGCRPTAPPPAPDPAPAALQMESDGNGPPLVLLGGGTDRPDAFAPHARLLATDFRVLRPLALRTERIRNQEPLPPGYSIRTESAALGLALDRLGVLGPVDLVGLSFGALVALDFALEHPDRIRSLVLTEPPAFCAVPPDELRADAQMRAMIELTRTLGPADEPTDDQLVQFLARLGRGTDAPPAPGQPGRADWDARRAALRVLAAVANHTDNPQRLRVFRRPVLIVTGANTVPFHRRINDRLAASLPAANRLELPGGHRASVTAPNDFVAKLRKFLATLI